MTYASLRQPKSQPNTDAHAADAPVEIGGAKAPRDSSDRTLLVGTCALLLFAPLAFGAVEPWAVFLLEAASAALLMAWAFNQLRSFQLSIALNPLFAPMLAFGLLVAFQLLFRQSAYHEATLSAALKYCAYAALCFLLHQCLTRTSYVRRLAATCCLYGLAIALFALLQSISSNGKLYWIRLPRNGGWIYGPYVNHNHYAGLMEMLAPLPLVFALTHHARGARKIVAVAAASFMAATIFLSGSRGGMLAFGFQMIVLACFLIRQRESRRIAVALGVFLLTSLLLLLWLGGAQVAARLGSVHAEAQSELSGGTRLQIDRDALRMFAHRPVSGWGLGVFPDVYPKFRTFHTNFQVNAAHNDYLQLLAETGSLGGLIMLWFIGTVYWTATRKIRGWQRDINGAMALSAMLAVTGILVHSFFDFNLQIPANAALFFAFCTVATMPRRFHNVRARRARTLDFWAAPASA